MVKICMILGLCPYGMAYSRVWWLLLGKRYSHRTTKKYNTIISIIIAHQQNEFYTYVSLSLILAEGGASAWMLKQQSN